MALQWLAFLRQRHPDSLDLLSTVGCLQLVIGHTGAAATTFQVPTIDLSRLLEATLHCPVPWCTKDQRLNLIFRSPFLGPVASEPGNRL